MKIKTLQEPVVVHHWAQYDGSREMADELFKLLSVEHEGHSHTPSFSYRSGKRDVRIDRFYLKEGDYFEIARTSEHNSEPGYNWMLKDAGAKDIPADQLDKFILIEEKEIDFGR